MLLCVCVHLQPLRVRPLVRCFVPVRVCERPEVQPGPLLHHRLEHDREPLLARRPGKLRRQRGRDGDAVCLCSSFSFVFPSPASSHHFRFLVCPPLAPVCVICVCVCAAAGAKEMPAGLLPAEGRAVDLLEVPRWLRRTWR